MGGRRLAIVLATGAYLTGVLVLLTRGSLAGEFFFDEAWRADLVRSSSLFERYDDNIAPIPLAWLVLMRGATTIVPDGFRGLRLTSLALAAPGLVAMVGIVHEAFHERWGEGRAWAYGLLATTVVLLAPGVHQIAGYLNDYLFQAGWTAAFVLVWLRFSRRDTVAGGRALLAGVVLLPLGTISGAFVLPAALVDLTRRTRSGATTALRTGQVLASFALSAALTAALAVWLYLPRLDDSLASFWARTSLRQAGWGAVGELPDRVWATTLVRETHVLGGGIRFSTLAALAVVALAVVGFVAIGRRWSMYPIAAATAAVVTAAVSVVADWPITPERVNLPVWWMAWLAVGIGLVATVDAALRRPELVIAAVAAIAVLLVPVTPESRTEPFAVGLYGDLAVVRGSPATENVVLAFHPMSHFYAHDALVNEDTGDRRFSVVADLDDEPDLLEDPMGAARSAGWAPGAVIWCVVPYEVGGDSARACRLETAGLVPGVDHHGVRARITSWSASPS